MMQRLQGLQGLDRAMAMGIASYAGLFFFFLHILPLYNLNEMN